MIIAEFTFWMIYVNSNTSNQIVKYVIFFLPFQLTFFIRLKQFGRSDVPKGKGLDKLSFEIESKMLSIMHMLHKESTSQSIMDSLTPFIDNYWDMISE